DPSADLANPQSKTERDRVLTDDEVRRFWHGCTAIGYPFGPIGKLLLLTATRRSEVAELPWEGELDIPNRVWHLPGARTKNGMPIDIHLSDLALQVLAALPPRDERSRLVFSTTRTTPASGFAYAKKRLDKFVEASNWVIHDLRRTATTKMAERGVAPHVADRN